MGKSNKHLDEANALRVQKHMQDQSQNKLTELELGVGALQADINNNIEEIDAMMLQLEHMLSNDHGVESFYMKDSIEISEISSESRRAQIQEIDFVEIEDDDEWDGYLSKIERYADLHNMDLKEDPFRHILTDAQRIEIERRIDKELTLRNAQCDKYEYMLAATCGAFSGLIDILFVGVPKDGVFTKVADQAVNKSVERFARLCGWKGPKDGSDPTKSAIGFLEKKFQVNYDQTTTNSTNPKRGTSGQVKNLSARNHHVRSLGHSPDLIGLFFSIYNQFTSTTSFFDGGKIITIDSQTFELRGSNFVAKVFAGFCNWLGHLFSDMAGSSGSIGRGSGIPIPFYSLLQLIDIGKFVQKSGTREFRQSFATISVKVFESGYDFRHGLAMAVPVLLSEVTTRLCWSIKRRYYHGDDFLKCIPNGSVPEVRRMLLVSHGVLCIVDGADAGLKSGGDIVQFMLRANLIAWVRFGYVGLKESHALWSSGRLDVDQMNEELDREYERLLSAT